MIKSLNDLDANKARKILLNNIFQDGINNELSFYIDFKINKRVIGLFKRNLD